MGRRFLHDYRMTEGDMLDQVFHAEPVPAISQLAVLPFLSAVEGFLKGGKDVPALRLTIHRVMSRRNLGYLQQLCPYLGMVDPNWRQKVGRAFPVTKGIMGAAFKHSCIWRTKEYAHRQQLLEDLANDAVKNGEEINLDTIALSYLAIPLLGPGGQAVIIVYADCREFNFFADDNRVTQVRFMCDALCQLLDWFQEEPLPNIRNFPFQKGVPVADQETVYETIQERWTTLNAPRFTKLYSFNLEG
jgi:hypothetical protein